MKGEDVARAPGFGLADTRAAAGRLLTLVALVNLLHTMDRNVINALLEPIRHDLNLTDTQLGFLSGLAYSLAAVVVAVPAGTLADRFSRKTIITIALTIWSAMTALCGTARGYTMLAWARMGVGGAEAAAPISAMSMIADLYPIERRSGAIGIFYAVGGIGTLLSFSLGAYIGQTYGWRWAFFMASMPAIILVPVLLLFLAEPARGGSPGSAKRAGLALALATIRSDRRLVILLVANTLANIGPVALIGWATSLLVREHAMALKQAGVFVAIASGLCVPLGQFIGGGIGDRLARKSARAPMWFAGAVCLAWGVFGAVAALSPATPIAIGALWTASFCMLLNMGPIMALLLQLSPPLARATIFAIVSVLGNLVSWGGGPLIVGRLSDAIGGPHSLSYAMAIAMSLSLLPTALFALLARRLGADGAVASFT
jgi:MFS family permease